MNTELDSFKGFWFESIPLTPITLLISLTLAILLYYLFRKRSGSSYGLINRLYSLLSGVRDFENKTLLSFRKEIEDVERFNALFNVKAKSLSEILQFRNWLLKFDLDIKRFSCAREWFCIETRKLRRPNRWEVSLSISSLIIGAFSLILSYSLATLSMEDSALVIVKESDNWIWLKEDKATDFKFSFEASWVVSQQMCEEMGRDFEKEFEKLTMKREELSLHDLIVICNAITRESDKNEISKMIQKQKWLSMPAIIFFLISFYQINSMVRLNIAYKARSYLYRKIKATRYKNNLNTSKQ